MQPPMLISMKNYPHCLLRKGISSQFQITPCLPLVNGTDFTVVFVDNMILVRT